MKSILGIENSDELKEWTLFLDRDGVINRRLIDDYVKLPIEFEYLHDSPKHIAEMSQLFRYTFVVTNQQGVGKGLMSFEDVETIHGILQEDVNKKGGQIDCFYVCPSLAAANSPYRKPEIGMALQAQQSFSAVDFTKSIMVGDSQSDMEFGRNAGMKTVFVSDDKDYTNSEIDYVVYSLEELNVLLKTL